MSIQQVAPGQYRMSITFNTRPGGELRTVTAPRILTLQAAQRLQAHLSRWPSPHEAAIELVRLSCYQVCND